MWQVLLAAAVAGSGFYAKRLLNINGSPHSLRSTQKSNQLQHQEQLHSAHKSSSPPTDRDTETEIPTSRFDHDESIFRFSSASASFGRTGPKTGSSKLRKKLGYNGSRGNVEKKRDTGAKLGEDHDQRKSGKRFALCLKKRRTGRHSSASTSKDSPSFGWGVGVGMMYMMSAGKAEISRLNTVMDETVKVVQELKTEIAKRKSYRTNTNQPVKLKNESCDELECPSSVITEETQLVEPEIDQLEAELESELQKLPFCRGEMATSYNLKTEEIHDQFGVKPTELDQKLCHLLIEQQEVQIVELESLLQRTNSKLNEKDAQLQSLKDCVRRLTHVSLDEETEWQLEERIIDGVYEKIETKSNKSTAGMKRTIDHES